MVYEIATSSHALRATPRNDCLNREMSGFLFAGAHGGTRPTIVSDRSGGERKPTQGVGHRGSLLEYEIVEIARVSSVIVETARVSRVIVETARVSSVIVETARVSTYGSLLESWVVGAARVLVYGNFDNEEAPANVFVGASFLGGGTIDAASMD